MKFYVSIDFNDDMWRAETDWSADHLRAAVDALAQRGISGIRWVDHGRLNEGAYDPGSGFNRDGCASRLCQTVPDPRQVIIDAAHARGMEVVEVFKPWDLAFGSPSLVYPHGHGPRPPVGLPEVAGEGGVAVHWLRAHPEKRERLHPSLLETDSPRKPIRTIRLWHENGALPDAPRIDLYVSHDNHTYEKYDGPMRVTQEVRHRRPPVFAPAPERAFGEPGDFACIELTDLDIDAPFVCVYPTDALPLANTLAAIMEVEDSAGDPVVYTWGTVPRQPRGEAVPWWNGGIAYDCARQGVIPRPSLHNTSAGRFRIDITEQHWLALARGRNEFPGGHVELADPDVRAWLLSWVHDALDAGMDGVDIRMGSHTESLDWENYGFSAPVVDAYRERFGVDITKEPFDRPAWRDLRGEHIDHFLREVSDTVRARGGKMLVHLIEILMDRPASERCAYEIAWHWRDWLREGVVDEATFKQFQTDGAFYREAFELCRERGIAINAGRKPPGKDKQQGWLDDIERAHAHGADAFDLYEQAIFMTLRGDGELDFAFPKLWERIASLTGGHVSR